MIVSNKDPKKLTKIQSDTLKKLKEYIAKNGKSPTLSELAGDFGVKLQTISDRLTALKKKGFIRKLPHSWRNIEFADKPMGDNNLVQIPVVGSVGADQMSIFAQEEYDQFLQVEEKLLDGYREVIAIKVIGNSMRDANIYNGDYVFVENNYNSIPSNGSVVVAIIDDKAVVKEYYSSNNLIELRPRSKNNNYLPIIIDPNIENFRIVGRVINILSFSDKKNDDYQVTLYPGEKL